MKSLGSFLKLTRSRRKISQEVLAKKAGLARSYISRLEDDKVKYPSAIVLIRLSNALGISSQSLFESAGYEPHMDVGLPSLNVYLRTKFPHLSEESIRQIENYKGYIEKYIEANEK